MPEHAVHYYHNNLTESDLDPNTVALATAILYQTPIQAAIEVNNMLLTVLIGIFKHALYSYN